MFGAYSSKSLEYYFYEILQYIFVTFTTNFWTFSLILQMSSK